MTKYFKGAVNQMAQTDSRLTEFWFGVQAFGTSLLSLLFASDSIQKPTIVFLVLNVIFAIPQAVLAWLPDVKMRHWSNWITSTFSFCISISFIGQEEEIVAVFGYGFLGLATLHCAFLTNRLLHLNSNHDSENSHE